MVIVFLNLKTMSLFLFMMFGTVVVRVPMVHFGMEEFEQTLLLEMESYVIQLGCTIFSFILLLFLFVLVLVVF